MFTKYRVRISTVLIFCILKVYSSDFNSGGIYYEFIEGGVAVSRLANYDISDIVIPTNVKHKKQDYPVLMIKDKAFYFNDRLMCVKVNASLRSIGEGAFAACNNLRMVLFDGSVDSIKINAFANCSKLETVRFSEHIGCLGASVFENDSLLKYIKLPNGIISIGDNCFSRTGLRNINIPNSVKSIGNKAFYQCKHLQSVSMSPRVISLGRYLFYYCTSLKNVVLPSLQDSIPHGMFSFCTSLKDILIPSSVKYVGSSAFSACYSLEQINIPNGIGKLEKRTFEACRSLDYIDIPSSIKAIDNQTFMGCFSLKKLHLPCSIDTLGQDAFSMCSSLDTLYIPASVHSIGFGLLSFNGGNTVIKVDSLNPFYNDGQGASCIMETSTNTLIVGSNQTVMPANTTAMAPKAFAGCKYLINLKITNSIATLPSEVFSGCTHLEHIEIPESVTEIHEHAFKDCISLKSILIPSNVKKFIGCGFFAGCDNLEVIKVESNNENFDDGNGSNCIIETLSKRIVAGCRTTNIPPSTREIHDEAFFHLKRLKKVNIPDSVTIIGNNAFSLCDSIEELHLPCCFVEIHDGAFSGIKMLKSVKLPKKMRSIGDVFPYCSGLEEIIIPKESTSFSIDDFFCCKYLKRIISYMKEPNQLYGDLNDDFNHLTLHVPKGCKKKYLATYPWSKFHEIIEMDE